MLAYEDPTPSCAESITRIYSTNPNELAFNGLAFSNINKRIFLTWLIPFKKSAKMNYLKRIYLFLRKDADFRKQSSCTTGLELHLVTTWKRKERKQVFRFILGTPPKFRNDHNHSSRYIITDDPNEFIKL